jgi:Tat protein translocase TatB subunit
VFLLILDSLGSTELLFILVMALVFFGPRKLPQLSRSLGKNIAEFRKASEDFKRTWEREVAFEESNSETDRERVTLPENTSIMNSEIQHNQFPEPLIEPVAAADAVSRNATSSPRNSALAAETSESADDPTRSEPPRKQDWL